MFHRGYFMAGTLWSPMGMGFNLDSIIDAADGKQGPRTERMGFFPTVGTEEDEEKIVLRLEVPGFGEDDLHVCLVKDALQVRGEVRTASGEIKQVGRTPCVFVRSFGLPEGVDRDGMRATYKSGVLTVILPKAEDEGRIEAAA
jgi:HSP20 family protein